MWTVLIVDDDEAICDLVREQLAGEGHVCHMASNAHEALEALKIHSFDVILLDIILPGETGMDLLAKLETSFQTIAIIMMTAVKDVDTAVQAMKLGASDYVIKPFTVDKLTSSIAAALKNTKENNLVSGANQVIVRPGYGDGTADWSLNAMNAIAYGVDAQIEYFDFHSKVVAEKTIDLAQRLGLPAKTIEKWAAAWDELHSERHRRIESTLSKLKRNSIAQMILGLTRVISGVPKPGGQQN